MKYVKTETALYITLGNSVEVVQSTHPRFNEAAQLIESGASDKKILNTLFGDLVNEAKDLLVHLGERTVLD